MSNKRWLRSHVERCLQEIWQVPAVVIDNDGDYGFRSETGACWVRLETQADPWLVAVFAHAAYDVKKTAKLLGELDEIASSARAASVFYVGGVVVVRQALLARTLDRRSLHFALDGVAAIADQVGQLVTAVHGGATPFQAEIAPTPR